MAEQSKANAKTEAQAAPQKHGAQPAMRPATNGRTAARSLHDVAGNQAVNAYLDGLRQRNLAQTTPGDAIEQGAEHLAQRALDEKEAPSGTPQGDRERTPSPLPREGAPLDPPTRTFFARRMDDTFADVRVHTNRAAAESAAALDARAYTVGADIVFAAGSYAPGTPAGSRLLAHELAHVAQQRRGLNVGLAFQKFTTFKTDPISFTRKDIETEIGKGSYWEQRVFGAYNTTYFAPVTGRFKASKEERDAVLAALWEVRPKQVKSRVTKQVAIPTRGTKTKALLYEFVWIPKGKGDKQPKLEIHFKAEGPKAKVSAAPAPAAGYTPSALSVGSTDFPEPIADYWKKHPDEQKQVYNWVENVAGATFDTVLTTKTTFKKKDRSATFRVEGTKAGGKVTKLEITFLGATAPEIVTPPKGYDKKDFVDLLLDQARAKANDKLGTISGLNTVPADEAASVKYAIWQYIEAKTQNTELDVIVPIANKTTRVFYTLRFAAKDRKRKAIDVTVERVGQEKAGTAFDLEQVSLRRVHGFADNSTDVATLTAWLRTRYPGVAPKGTTVADIVQDVNSKIKANAGTVAWFKDNYDIDILSDVDGATRLQSVHGYDPGQVADMKTFTADELRTLEFALERFSPPLLAMLKGARLVRQKVKLVKKGNTITPEPKTGGFTLTKGADKTVIIFDRALQSDQLLFVGGPSGVRKASTLLFAHEFGHVVEAQNSIKAKFNAFVKKKKIKPPTWYAKSNVTGEFFPEALALYNSDPDWMKLNLPDLYAWFETLSKTGSPP